MEFKFYEIILGALMSILVGVCSILWGKADRAEKTAQSNAMMLNHLTKSIDKTGHLTERMASLEASVSVEIKNLSVSIKRLENAVLRINQHTRK